MAFNSFDRRKVIDGIIACIERNCSECPYVSSKHTCESIKLKTDVRKLSNEIDIIQNFDEIIAFAEKLKKHKKELIEIYQKIFEH